LITTVLTFLCKKFCVGWLSVWCMDQSWQHRQFAGILLELVVQGAKFIDYVSYIGLSTGPGTVVLITYKLLTKSLILILF